MPLGPEHWAIVRGILHSKWGSVVVVDHVVILEAGHCTIISTAAIFLFLSDVDIGVNGCGDGKQKEKELALDERR